MATGDPINGSVAVPVGVIPPWNTTGGPFKTEMEAGRCCGLKKMCVGCADFYTFPRTLALLTADRSPIFDEFLSDYQMMTTIIVGEDLLGYAHSGVIGITQLGISLTVNCLPGGGMRLFIRTTTNQYLFSPTTAENGWAISASDVAIQGWYKDVACGAPVNMSGPVGTAQFRDSFGVLGTVRILIS